MLVYVLNNNGEPLMPCSPAKARKLLKENKAKIVKRDIFTIQLLYGSSGYKQPISLGIDAGSKIIGVSATTEIKEVFAAEYTLRNDVSGLIADRKMYRISRRGRKTRYRKARFLNRKKTKQPGWIAPSIKHKIDCHVSLIDKIHSFLPISKVNVETAEFDIHKLKNPDIKPEHYAKGEQYGFENMKAYIRHRDGYTCQHCKGKTKDKRLEIHHIIFRSNGGTNQPSNLITLCATCHAKVHTRTAKLKVIKTPSFKDAAFMNIMRTRLLNRLSAKYTNVKNTFGYITKADRLRLGLDKSHNNDAFCISENLGAIKSNFIHKMKKVRCQNRQIHKALFSKGGKRKVNQSPYIVHGFRLFDKVKYDGREWFIFARRLSGYFTIKSIDFSSSHQNIQYKKLQLVHHRGSLIITK